MALSTRNKLRSVAPREPLAIFSELRGAIEAAFCVLSIYENIVPPTLNLAHQDVGVGFNFVPQNP